MKSALRARILHIMDAAREMAIATVREDGFPQNTTVAFVHDGLTVCFACASDCQKINNLQRDARVSVTMTAPYESWKDIKALSMSARARRLTNPDDMKRAGTMIVERYPEAGEFANAHPDDIALIEVVPEIVSVLDYASGFGHSDQVIVSAGDITETSAREPHVWLPKSA